MTAALGYWRHTFSPYPYSLQQTVMAIMALPAVPVHYSHNYSHSSSFPFSLLNRTFPILLHTILLAHHSLTSSFLLTFDVQDFHFLSRSLFSSGIFFMTLWSSALLGSLFKTLDAVVPLLGLGYQKKTRHVSTSSFTSINKLICGAR